MRIVAVSDTHSRHRKLVLPEADIFIHAGDFTNRGRPEEIEDFNDWLGTLPYRYKLVVPGNHDLSIPKMTRRERESMLSNATLLIDDWVTLEGVKFYGTPWVSLYGNWAYMLREADLKAKYDLIPEDTDVLISHGPPQTVLDLTFRGVCAGSEMLRQRVEAIAPKVHVFGHIHEGYGCTSNGKTSFVNAAICDFYDGRMNAHSLINMEIA